MLSHYSHHSVGFTYHYVRGQPTVAIDLGPTYRVAGRSSGDAPAARGTGALRQHHSRAWCACPLPKATPHLLRST
eukprot:22043-Eustigmatos_ZCMA.PRE.1